MFGYSALARDVAYRSIYCSAMHGICLHVWCGTSIYCKGLCFAGYSPELWVIKKLGLDNFEVDKILQGLRVRFKLGIFFYQKDV